MRPLGYNIIVNELKEDIKTTSGGLMLGEAHRDDIRYRKAEIVSIGSDVPEGILEASKIVWIDRNAGSKIDLPTGLFTVIRLSDIVIVE